MGEKSKGWKNDKESNIIYRDKTKVRWKQMNLNLSMKYPTKKTTQISYK